MDQEKFPAKVETDMSPSSLSKGNDIETDEVIPVLDQVIQRSTTRKLDFRLLPLLSLMYLFNAARTHLIHKCPEKG
ncbi:MAG: hypothetical protein M1834_000863 [Cirrosporium novae-zelandiae]|nr:MAG: hypothetical protein M1834_000863 [Cirrosporium novae-zelandiae]